MLLRLALAAALALPIAKAWADGCGGRLLGAVPISAAHNVPIVTLSANGRPLTLILDTGAERTAITPAAAQRIGAQPPRIAFDGALRGIGASVASREVEFDSFAAGPVALPWRRVLVAAVAVSAASSGGLDGLLGADVLSDFDLDIDVPHNRLALHERQTCAAAAPDWGAPGARIDASRSLNDHLFFHARLDGQEAATIVDTGAQVSVVSASLARALGVGEAALAHDRAITTAGAAGERLVSRLHRFGELEVAGQRLAAPALIVTELSLRDADLVLGADFLRDRRLWMSYGAQRLFLGSG